MIIDGKELMIYAVDFDGTLIIGNKWPDVDGQMNFPLIQYLIDEQARGNKIILNTCRQGEALEVAIKKCKEFWLTFDAINENIPETIEAYGADSRKISADYYIDDRAINPNLFNWSYMYRMGLRIGYKRHEEEKDV